MNEDAHNRAIAGIAAAMAAFDAEEREVYWALEYGGDRAQEMWTKLATIAYNAAPIPPEKPTEGAKA